MGERYEPLLESEGIDDFKRTLLSMIETDELGQNDYSNLKEMVEGDVRKNVLEELRGDFENEEKCSYEDCGRENTRLLYGKIPEEDGFFCEYHLAKRYLENWQYYITIE